jgi:hypothetical protein
MRNPGSSPNHPQDQESLDHEKHNSGFTFEEIPNKPSEHIHQQPVFEFVALPFRALNLESDTQPNPSGTQTCSCQAKVEVHKVIEENDVQPLSPSTNSDISQEFFVHKQPLWIFQDRLNYRTLHHCQNAISFCILHNLGLYHHLIAIMSQEQSIEHYHGIPEVPASRDGGGYAKAIACYEMSYNLLESGEFVTDTPHWVYTTLVIVNNLGHAHLVLNDNFKAGCCTAQLWSILAYVRDGGMMMSSSSSSSRSIGTPYSTPPPSSSFLLRGMDGGSNALDGFLENAIRHCTPRSVVVAPAA